VLVTAPAGLGKSRLRHEITERILASVTGARMWFARGQLVGRGSAFALLAQLLRSFADIQDGDRPELQRERLSRSIGNERIAEFLGEAIGTPFETAKGSALDIARQNAAVMGDQMLQAWEDLVGAEAREHPLCIVLEDLHWADRASLRFLDAVLGRVADQRLFVLGFARPEVHGEFENLWSERDVLELRLSPLSKKASERMVREVLGEDVKPEVAQRIVERARGNAFFLEELIRAHVERGAEALPDSVVSTLQARLDGFTLDARQILRAGSVFGRAFWPGAVLTVLGPNTTRARVEEWLRILCEREVVTKSAQSRFPDETEYVFRHSLLRDAVYATLTERDREFSHQHAAEWLEKKGETDARVLCEHYELGSDSTSATELIAKAAQKALHGSDLAAAIAYAEHGLKKLGRGLEERRARAELGWTKSLAHLWRGENSEAALAAEDARASDTIGSELWFKASWVAIAACGRLGDYERLTALGSALSSCPVHPDAELARLLTLTQVVIQGLNAAKLAFAEQILALLPDSAEVATEDAILAAAIDRCRASHASHRGDLASCLRYTQASVARLDTAGDLRASALQRVNLGYAEILLGRWALAKEHLVLALQTSEQHLLHNVSAMAKNNLGLVLMRLGDHAEGLSIEREAIEAFARYGDKRMEGASRLYVARDLLECGDARGATLEASRAVELAGTLPSLRCYAQAILGGALLVDGDSEGALRALDEAMTTFERHGAEEGEILIRVFHRNALRAAGRAEEAARAAAVTRARVEELASAISDDELRQSFLANVPENRDALAT
jgi:tetratricopeptide (TPR) repeat protein